MATFNLKRFSKPETLKSIRADRLLEFLEPYAKFFADRGVPLPPKGRESEFDYEGLAKALMSPDSDTPSELANSLYFVDQMSTASAMDDLSEECERRGLRVDGGAEVTPADVAVQVWLLDPRLLERTHATQYLIRPRSFDYYRTKVRPVPKFRSPSQAAVTALEKELDDWFEKRRRGRGARVFLFPEADAVWFLVRHGQPFERRGVIKDGESSSLFFRGEAHDVLAYDRSLGELRVHASTKGEKEAYRKGFGRHLFGDVEHFSGGAKYTLEPLRTAGEKSLACGDIDGMESVTLRQIEFFWGGAQKEVEARRATDVFAAFAKHERKFPARVPITRATFSVMFKDSKTPRTITVRTPRTTQYMRDGDSTIAERWLYERLFVLRDE